jgi:hypothetical protein
MEPPAAEPMVTADTLAASADMGMDEEPIVEAPYEMEDSLDSGAVAPTEAATPTVLEESAPATDEAAPAVDETIQVSEEGAPEDMPAPDMAKTMISTRPPELDELLRRAASEPPEDTE